MEREMEHTEGFWAYPRKEIPHRTRWALDQRLALIDGYQHYAQEIAAIRAELAARKVQQS